jgi:outer membrane protein OmpA-like peptidoglycan-associated protein
MHSRPLNFLGRILLVGCAMGLGASVLLGQSSSSAPAASTASQPPASRSDVFVGFSYLSPHGSVATTMPDGTTQSERYSAINEGAIGSYAYYVNRYVGGQIEFAFHPDGPNDGAGSGQGGLILRLPEAGMTPFAHFLAGAVDLAGPNYHVPGLLPGDNVHHPYTIGPALTAGVGLDYEFPGLSHRFALRIFQADYEYYHVDYGPQNSTGGRANTDGVQLSTGLVMHFGSIAPPPPVQYACAVNSASIYPGEQITVTGTATNLNPKKSASYTWSGQGVTVSGTSATATIDTGSLAPGSYTVTGHVTEGPKPWESADCTTQFAVKAFEPPTVSCSASPTTLKPGDSATISATGVSPQNRPLTYSYSASAGSVNGSGNSATLSTTGAPAGSITVTCNVQDDKGQTASATTTVDVEQPPAPPAPKTSTLCSIQFDHDKARPARVDNEAKACLDDVALNAQQKPDATVVVVGNSAPVTAPKGKHAKKSMSADDMAAQRAVNTKAYLVTEKGIDASRVQVRTGTDGQNEVQDYLVPAGASFDTDVSGTTAVDENTVKAQARTAPPAVHHHHHKAASK